MYQLDRKIIIYNFTFHFFNWSAISGKNIIYTRIKPYIILKPILCYVHNLKLSIEFTIYVLDIQISHVMHRERL